MIHYKITPSPLDHEWHILLTFTQDDDLPIEISLPNWVPGSYLIRDFSRHITSIHASCNGTSMPLEQIAKNRWHAAAVRGEWQIRYTVYAFDLSVRGSFLTTERGFFDGSCLFLKVEGTETLPHRLELTGIPSEWRIATTLPETGRFVFQAASYAELIDRPVEMGLIEFLDFEAAGIPHTIALSGIYPDFDRNRLVSDIKKICETELAVFSSPAPFQKYLFLLHVGDHIYGGLEHTDSTALLADRHSLPPYGMTDADDTYTTLLGLFSHEYFHAWNVKSIKPAAFVPYDLDKENYTEQLWAFEGITSYYDDLFLARSRTISPESYLNLLAQGITRVQQTRGRLRQTLAESSFTAWNKFYKPDENSPNAIVSYYQKGALAALCLDLIIRNRSNGRHSLDTLMDKLYREWRDTHSGIPEKHWQIRCQEITGLDLEDFFQKNVIQYRRFAACRMPGNRRRGTDLPAASPTTRRRIRRTHLPRPVGRRFWRTFQTKHRPHRPDPCLQRRQRGICGTVPARQNHCFRRLCLHRLYRTMGPIPRQCKNQYPLLPCRHIASNRLDGSGSGSGYCHPTYHRPEPVGQLVVRLNFQTALHTKCRLKNNRKVKETKWPF